MFGRRVGVGFNLFLSGRRVGFGFGVRVKISSFGKRVGVRVRFSPFCSILILSPVLLLELLLLTHMHIQINTCDVLF